jgi:hypothetical protein
VEVLTEFTHHFPVAFTGSFKVWLVLALGLISCSVNLDSRIALIN